ncbi:arginine--tRNA ligase [Candidatus Woesearchaeota archaeon]|nr:arginine--tRNA ligase [Candidatus Woesearchaeota archaeon]
MNKFKKSIIASLDKVLAGKTGIPVLEKPPDPTMGDYAFPCFSLAKHLKKNPAQIAKDLAGQIKPDQYISNIKAIGPYVNFFVNKEELAKDILSEIYQKKGKYGSGKRKKGIVMIESPGPNTNKPLHLGHVRNMVLGNSLVNIYKFLGNKSIRVDILNNRGVHICKSMLAYEKFGNSKRPDKKTDHFVGEFYVKYAKELPDHPEFEDKIQEMLRKWESGDLEVRQLWSKMNDWAVKGIMQTYDRYGVAMDKPYFESDHYMKGKEIVKNGLERGIFEKDENDNIVANLSKHGLGKKVVLRADGTSIYITQDLVLAKIRYGDYKMDKMIYIVGNEHIHHFKVLFKIFEILKYPFAKDCYHLAYGMIYLPEGKMKSREGKVVDADNLADNIHEMAKKEIKKRYKELSTSEIDKRAEEIGMGAIKFFILKYDPMKDFIFNPKESLSFEGETGPYVQYTHARASSILRKHKKQVVKNVDFSLLRTEEERAILGLLEQFPSLIEKSAENYKPSLIANYLIDLSQKFNEYYHKHQVIQEDKELEKARILLVCCVKQVLKIGLELLGIEALEVM